jgi:hypothetical protein
MDNAGVLLQLDFFHQTVATLIDNVGQAMQQVFSEKAIRMWKADVAEQVSSHKAN